jgi:hypothetical protein
MAEDVDQLLAYVRVLERAILVAADEFGSDPEYAGRVIRCMADRIEASAAEAELAAQESTRKQLH